MKKYQLFLLSLFLLSSCTREVCDRGYDTITHATGGVVINAYQIVNTHGAEGAMGGAILGGLLGGTDYAVLGAGIGSLAGGGTTSSRNIFTMSFSNGITAICDNGNCETPSGDRYSLQGDSLISRAYFVRNCREVEL